MENPRCLSHGKGFIWKDIGSICVTNDRIEIYKAG